MEKVAPASEGLLVRTIMGSLTMGSSSVRLLVPVLFFGMMLSVAGSFVASPSAAVSAQGCGEQARQAPEHLGRRTAAIRLARQVNTAEVRARHAQGHFVPLQALSVPSVDPSLRITLARDGAGYLLSIKDTSDACGYAVFSDDSGVIVEGYPIR